MLDIRKIEKNREFVIKKLQNRNFKNTEIVDRLLDLNTERKKLVSEFEHLRTEQNSRSKDMAFVMKSGSEEEKKKMRNALKELSEKVKSFDPEIKKRETKIKELILELPNIPDDDIPVGKNEENNIEMYLKGEKPVFSFTPRQHFEMVEKLFGFEYAAKMSGARFSCYMKKIARMGRALMNFMIDEHVKSGYAEIAPPVLVSRETMTRSGQLPKFEDDAFKTTDDMFLIPTAEVPLVSIHAHEKLDADELPRRYVAYTPCFRREAGSYGKDTRGIIRLHQFNKVELVQITEPEHSDRALQEMLSQVEKIMEKLELHYRVVKLCTGDIGFASKKTYDIEVWLPGQNRYREISSCSNTGDFQARRADIRFKKEGGKPNFVHALNGSGLAIDRSIVAILETHQNSDGSVNIPHELRPYMDHKKVIFPE
ncbi:MAG: serine--tRNA ligase [bacterium]